MDVVGYADLPILLLFWLKVKLITTCMYLSGDLSLARLAITLAIGLLAFGLLHQRKASRLRAVRLRVLIRAMFPQKFFRRSTGADVFMTSLNIFLFGLVFGWALLSSQTIARFTTGLLLDFAGPVTPTAWSPAATSALITFAIFIAYEWAYWFDHYLSHRVPFLWEFHKVHHTAEVLTPITIFRVHPIDTIVFYNLLALAVGVTEGAICYLMGTPVEGFTLWNKNLLMMVAGILLQQLQHTHFWIPFTGIWGKIFLSPAHHQIHHSANPVHFNKNLGGNLSIFDWLFGTLYIPAKKREKLTFGVLDPSPLAHRPEGLLVTPVIHAVAHIKAAVKPEAPKLDAAVEA
jgi:sterol desaturase/sphingolipid hydroxylase (fatty acid hydroxylase superfamily)